MVETKAKKHKKAEGELPLLEEVNELIEKERLLMQLKLLEQQRAAEEWKAKYESLVGNASKGSSGNQTLAKVGNENEAPGDGNSAIKKNKTAPPTTTEGLQQMLMDLEHDWVLDLSNVKVDNKLLSLLNSEVFSARGCATHNITVCSLANTSLEDDSMLALTTLAGKASVQALDLRGNNLGPQTFQNLVGAVKSRRKSPQYLLLNANLPLMGASVTPLLTALTDSTWGVHLSLQDVSHGQLSEHHSSAKKIPTVPGKAAAGAGAKGKGPVSAKDATAALIHTKEALSAGLYSNSVQPHKALEAIKCLCDILNPPDQVGKGPKGLKKAPAAQPGIIRTSKITTLSVLGMTHAHMSLESVTQMCKLLQDAGPSLTDLDLSFSYTGQNGANMLKNALASSGCQLIRIAAPGNSFGDSGINALAQGLRSNKTLTFLDVRSNQITPPGLRALCSALTAAKPIQINEDGTTSTIKAAKGYNGNNILSTIDIGLNVLSQADIIYAEKGLRDWGIDARLKCTPTYPGYNDTSAEVAAGASIDVFRNVLNVPRPDGSFVLYQQPNRSFCSLENSGAKIYSIDLRYANAHYAYHADHPLHIEWSMRPQSERTAASKEAASGTGGTASNIPWLSEPTRLRWELRLETPTSDTVIMRGELSAGSCLFNQQGEDSSWARCHAMAYNVPIKGSLELYVFCCDGTHCPPGIEASELYVYSVPPLPLAVVGGDCAAWSGNVNNSISVYANTQFAAAWDEWKNDRLHGNVLRGFVPLRSVRWTLPATSARTGSQLTWQSKLTTVAGAYSEDKATLGYSWLILKAAGYSSTSQIIAQGSCHNSSSSLQGVLDSWTWKTMTAELSVSLCAGDIIVVAAKPQSPYEGSVVSNSSDETASCSVLMRNFNVWAGGSEESCSPVTVRSAQGQHAEVVDPSVGCGIGIFMQHNPSTLQMT